MNTAPNLDQLRDIHLPEWVGYWPLAWGWECLMGLSIFLLIVFAYLGLRWYYQARAKREALRLLVLCETTYRQEPNVQKTCAQIDELLKRVALVYFPREQVAHLHGESWLAFLKNSSHQLDVVAVRDALLLYPYQRHTQDVELGSLFEFARVWIKQRRKPCLF